MALEVEIVYATLEHQIIRQVTVSHVPATIADVLRISQILEQQQLALEQITVGIWGQELPLEWWVNDGDRIEIYVALLEDPKERRRKKVQKQRSQKG